MGVTSILIGAVPVLAKMRIADQYFARHAKILAEAGESMSLGSTIEPAKRRNPSAAFAPAAVLLLIASLLLWAAPAFADCPPGDVPALGGGCIPRGAVDCGVGRGYCDAGQVCAPTTGCMSPGDVDCGPTRGSCPAGSVCMKGNGCMPAGSVDCGDGGYCDAGHVCIGNHKCR